MAKRMPKDWDPPYPSWSSGFAPGVESVVIGYYASQAPSPASAETIDGWFDPAANAADGPGNVIRARFTDASGYDNHVRIGYWTDTDAFGRWESENAGWWESGERLSGETGFWRETLTVPVRRLETLFSTDTHPEGIGKLGSELGEPICEHAYWGGMRDRIPDGAGDEFEATLDEPLKKARLQETRGRRLTVAAPDNLAIILSAQNWEGCRGEELATYDDVVRPELTAGMAYLRDNPAATGCASCRFMRELDETNRPIDKSFASALFVSLKHLEDWAEHHPTHLAIFGAFHRMVKHHDFQLDLKLWHEVAVLENERCRFEYYNCHPRTGLLPHFPASQ